MSRASNRNNRSQRTGTKGAGPNGKGRNTSFITTNEVTRFTSKQISPDLMAILTNAGYLIRMEIRPGGNLVEIIDPRTGRSVGGLNDLSHFAGARKFVADERRAASSESTLDEQGAIVLFLIEEIRKVDKGFNPPSSLSSEFCIFLKTTAVKMAAIQENLETIADFPSELSSQKSSKLILQKMGGLLVSAHLLALMTFLKEGKLEKEFMSSELLKLGVPKWFANKLEVKLPAQSDPNPDRILFPPSAKGWLNLTFKEWRSVEVLKNIEDISRHSDWVSNMLSDDNFVRGFCGIDSTVDLGDRTLPLVSKLYESKVSLVPHCMSYDFAFEPISKNRDQGFWAVPRFDNPSNALNSLSQAICRSLLSFVSYSDVVTSFWNSIFPEIVIDRSKISKANNLQKMALTQASDTLREAYLTRLLFLEGDEARDNMSRLLIDQLGAGSNSPQQKLIAEYVSSKGKKYSRAENSGSKYVVPPKMDGLIKASDDRPRLKKVFDTTSTENRKGAIADILKIFPKKRGRDKPAALTARSVLGKKAQNFLSNRLSPKRNKILHNKMEIWFRAFTDPGMQDAAVVFLDAQFDELFMKQLDDLGEEAEEEPSDQEGESDGG